MVLGKLRTKEIHLVGGYELNKHPLVVPQGDQRPTGRLHCVEMLILSLPGGRA